MSYVDIEGCRPQGLLVEMPSLFLAGTGCECKKSQSVNANPRLILWLRAVGIVLPNKEMVSKPIVWPETESVQDDETLQQNGLLYADRRAKGNQTWVSANEGSILRNRQRSWPLPQHAAARAQLVETQPTLTKKTGPTAPSKGRSMRLRM